jgi:hypothetical protein
MKKALKVGAVLLALSLPVWANGPDGDKHKHKHEAVPEGGNWPSYTLVSVAAILGGFLLVSKQRATKAVQ